MDFYQDDPFNPAVPAITIPHGITVPKFTKYNGEGDPNTHLVTFRSKCLLLQAWPHTILWMFPMSLTTKAIDWYHSLLRGLVSSLEDIIS